jgi:general secretion pathway protein E
LKDIINQVAPLSAKGIAMISANQASTSPVQKTQRRPRAAAPRNWLDFASALARKHVIRGDLTSTATAQARRKQRRLRDLWELTDLSAGAFADEVAHFYELDRVDLPNIIAAQPLVAGFSRRFLREMSVFPFRADDGNFNSLAIADPTDLAAIRATELVLRTPVALCVASFEDIATALSERLGDEAATPIDGGTTQPEVNDDIENLRDLASGAPVVRAVSELLEQAAEARATDIHIEPHRGGITVRMRLDGLLRVIPIRNDLLPQAVISRIKILAGLNIAERRLPQDGAAHLKIARTHLDIRVATMPNPYGESAVIRLLPTAS